MPDFLRGFERGLQKNVADALRLVPRDIRAAARSGLDRRAGIVSSAKPLMGRNLATGITATGTAGVTLANLASRAAALPALVVAGKEVFNPKDNIITALQNLGTSVENQFAVPGQERRYVGSDPMAVARNRALDARAGLRTGLRDFGPGYRESELRAGAAAEAFRPGAGFPGQQVGSPAAERDYQQKVSRVAQLTAQDPELQRYEYARKQAKLAGPGSAAEQSAEDMGMQMWAKANPKLAAKVKPGQSGYDVIQRTLGAGQMGSPLNLPFDTSSPLGTTPPISPASYDAGKVAQGLGLSTVPRNAFAGASAASYAGFSQGPTLQSAPLGFPSEMPTASYAGATSIQPMGSAVDKFDPKGPEAQRLLEMFKDSIFTTQK
jgi:hypothetical protein